MHHAFKHICYLIPPYTVQLEPTVKLPSELHERCDSQTDRCVQTIPRKVSVESIPPYDICVFSHHTIAASYSCSGNSTMRRASLSPLGTALFRSDLEIACMMHSYNTFFYFIESSLHLLIACQLILRLAGGHDAGDQKARNQASDGAFRVVPRKRTCNGAVFAGQYRSEPEQSRSATCMTGSNYIITINRIKCQ